ncbi:predicted protein [Pyrenophora tritici-repentis Pt-1C-BFP]|uniref:Uncharacterized protein n=1 Tax=Pyrenophora tritici-repentis (strain Pt-1C-BFP) TaxID=426418 RepID=B2W3M0_PYRTR|nr:uncharacterized protein PTRG_05070 [Pyrenophora tritici-repentis Pt-1C-BFP]EDU47977.1 predicted protein [Pyrenophora tritici-repentis Pt-1C-BFP]
MASGSIGHVPAATFAEYVDDLFSTHHGHEAGAPQTLSGDEDKRKHLHDALLYARLLRIASIPSNCMFVQKLNYNATDFSPVP